MTPQDLATLESLSEKLYASPNDLDRQQATRALQAFLNPTKLEILPQMQYILDNTNSAFALFLACNTLAKLATEKWSLLNTQAKLDMREYFVPLYIYLQFQPLYTCNLLEDWRPFAFRENMRRN
jgi:hypothetical protein